MDRERRRWCPRLTTFSINRISCCSVSNLRSPVMGLELLLDHRVSNLCFLLQWNNPLDPLCKNHSACFAGLRYLLLIGSCILAEFACEDDKSEASAKDRMYCALGAKGQSTNCSGKGDRQHEEGLQRSPVALCPRNRGIIDVQAVFSGHIILLSLSKVQEYEFGTWTCGQGLPWSVCVGT